MKTKLLFSALLSFYFCLLSSQVPQGFSYQAAARDENGLAIKNTPLSVRMSIQPSLSPGNELWIETQTVTTDDLGVMSLVIGTGNKTGGTLNNFSDINWSAQPLFLKTEINKGSGYLDMGTTQLWSVPYSMTSNYSVASNFSNTSNVANDLGGPLGKLEVDGKSTTDDPALFEVKNTAGNTVFAVYNEGVRVYVDKGQAKSAKGGFAIGGFGSKGGDPHEYLRVDPGTINMYIDDIGINKSAKGGFAIGGFSSQGTKDGASFFNVDGAAAADAATIIDPSQNRILWYPYKNAFRAGKVYIPSSDDVGENSFATGFEARAKGQYSQALGYKCVSIGQSSVAIGFQSTSNGPYSTSFGDNNVSNGQSSISVGSWNTATGNNSTAIGLSNRAVGDYSVAIGYNSQAGTPGNAYACAIGYTNTASGVASVALGGWSTAAGQTSLAAGYGAETHATDAFSMGNRTNASGGQSQAFGDGTFTDHWASTAFGWKTKAQASLAVAMGAYTTAQSYASLVIGQYNAISGNGDSWQPGDPVFVIGNGSDDSHRSNVVTILKNGNVGIGTSSPACPLEITTQGGSFTGTFGYLNPSGATGTTFINNGAYSIHTVGRILCPEFNAISDKRIKEIVGHPDGEWNLSLINKLKVTDYKYIDKIANGSQVKQGFIAQEVEAILPAAVRISTGFIPDIYKLASSFFTDKGNSFTIKLDKKHNLVKGDKVKLIIPEGEVVRTVIAISDPETFSVEKIDETPSSVFVYGKEVNDFRSIDYDRIFTIGIGAIQELSRRNSDLYTAVDKLKSENQQLKSELQSLKEQMDKIEVLLTKSGTK